MTSPYVIQGKTALISGSNRGIGKALLEELISRGIKKVYAGARNIESLTDLRKQYGEKVVPIQLDVTDKESVQAATAEIVNVDILINNAGIFMMGINTCENNVEILQQNLNTNLFGLIDVTNGFLNEFKKQKSGVIVNMSSLAGLSNMPLAGTYSISKAAVHSFTQGLRAELASSTVSVIGVYPGPIDTEMAKELDMEKETPLNAAKVIVDAISNGVEDVYPDPLSKATAEILKRDAKEVEKNFAQFLAQD